MNSSVIYFSKNVLVHVSVITGHKDDQISCVLARKEAGFIALCWWHDLQPRRFLSSDGKAIVALSCRKQRRAKTDGDSHALAFDRNIIRTPVLIRWCFEHLVPRECSQP